MCYPIPGPKCANKMLETHSHISRALNNVYEGSRSLEYYGATTDYVSWANTIRGQREIASAISMLSRHSVLNGDIISFLNNALSKGKRERNGKLAHYGRTVIRIGNDTFKKDPSIDQIELIVKQLSASPQGSDYLLKRLNQKFSRSVGVQALQSYKQTGIQELDALALNMNRFANNAHLVGKDTEDYRLEKQGLSERYTALMNRYSGVLTKEERAKIDHLCAVLNIPFYDEAEILKVYICPEPIINEATPVREEKPSRSPYGHFEKKETKPQVRQVIKTPPATPKRSAAPANKIAKEGLERAATIRANEARKVRNEKAVKPFPTTPAAKKEAANKPVPVSIASQKPKSNRPKASPCMYKNLCATSVCKFCENK